MIDKVRIDVELFLSLQSFYRRYVFSRQSLPLYVQYQHMGAREMFVIKESRPGKAGNRRTLTATPTFSVRIKRDQQSSWQPCRDS